MRPIKFRMWDTKATKFFTNQPEVFACLIQQIDGRFDHIKNGSAFEQFTGLHDKNGKEIYEGDVVSLIGNYDGDMWEPSRKGKVVFEDGCFLIEPHCVSVDSASISNWGMEVIGNIHEGRV